MCVFVFMCVGERLKKTEWVKQSPNHISHHHHHHRFSPLCRAASLELGWDMQIQAVCLPAPSEAAEQHDASCTHTLTHAECWGLGWSSLVSRSHTLSCVCVSWNFPRDTLFPPSFLCSALLFLLSPLLQHTFVLFSLPLFLSPPSSASLVLPLLLSCVLRLWLVSELRAYRGARCCWCYSCSGSMYPSGPTEEDETAHCASEKPAACTFPPPPRIWN